MQPGNPPRPKSSLGRIKFAAYSALALSIVALVLVASVSVVVLHNLNGQTTASTTVLAPITVSGELITPPLSLADAPPILTQAPFGQTLMDINVPFNSTQLAVINDGPDSYFETAAQMYLNGSLTSAVGQEVAPAPLFTVNGKPAVTYLGAISCVYCGENRWAMALALSRFGSFGNLFIGYSSFGDEDVPTIYWAPAHYNSTAAVDWGNFYNSTYITFLSIDFASTITAGFNMGALSYFQQEAKAVNNTVYEAATNLIVNENNYAGTPYTIWGKYAVLGADAQDFGDTTSTATTTQSTALPISSMTHQQILDSFADPTTPFAWTEYAAADYYISLVCASLGVGSSSSMSAPPICTNPSISDMTALAEKA
jgi:hypothetical protein